MNMNLKEQQDQWTAAKAVEKRYVDLIIVSEQLKEKYFFWKINFMSWGRFSFLIISEDGESFCMNKLHDKRYVNWEDSKYITLRNVIGMEGMQSSVLMGGCFASS